MIKFDEEVRKFSATHCIKDLTGLIGSLSLASPLQIWRSTVAPMPIPPICLGVGNLSCVVAIFLSSCDAVDNAIV